MADGLDVKVSGIADFKAAITALVADMRRKVVRAALRDAARPVIRAAQNNAPVLRVPKRNRRPGTLKRNIKVFASKVKNGRNGVLGVFIKVRASKAALKKGGGAGAKNPNDPYYWLFQEFGFTATGRRRLRGGSRRRDLVRNALISSGRARRIEGRHFLQRGFQQGQGEALAIFQRRIGERIAAANQNK